MIEIEYGNFIKYILIDFSNTIESHLICAKLKPQTTIRSELSIKIAIINYHDKTCNIWCHFCFSTDKQQVLRKSIGSRCERTQNIGIMNVLT